VLVVDDHAVVRYGVLDYLTNVPDFTVVGEAENGIDAVEQARDLRPDVVLMDLKMPRMDGIAATATVRRELPGTEVVVLSAVLEASWVVSAVRAGALGYLGKNASEEHVSQAIRQAKCGHVHLTAEVAATLMREMRALEVPEPLSAREMEVLQMLAHGQASRQIADLLRISDRTVRGHISHLMLKLGVESRGELPIRAVHLGILPVQVLARAG
jgi:DNA-binding NarL/FixJ family response regulator